MLLENSYKDYNKIRQLLMDKKAYPVLEFYSLNDHVMVIETSSGGAVNASDHIWG